MTLGTFRPLDTLVTLRALGALRALGTLRTFVAFRALRTLVTLGSLRAFVTLGALVAFGPLHFLAAVFTAFHPVFAPVLAALGAVFTPIFAPVFAAILALIARFPLVAQIDAQAVVLIADTHALEVELAGEVGGELGELLALLGGKTCLANAHVAYALLEEGADLGEQPVKVQRPVRLARHVDQSDLALIFAAVLTSILSPVFAAVLTPVFPAILSSVFAARVVGLRAHSAAERSGDAESGDRGRNNAFIPHGQLLHIGWLSLETYHVDSQTELALARCVTSRWEYAT